MASDILLEIVDPKIPGESVDKDHPNTIEVAYCNFGVSQETSMQTGSGLVAGGARFDSFQIGKNLDKSSLKLFQHCAAGSMINAAKLFFRRPGEKASSVTNNQPVDYMVIEFKDLLVTSYSTSGSGGSANPSESISFDATSCKVSYREIKDGQPGGAISGGYDLKKNKKI